MPTAIFILSAATIFFAVVVDRNAWKLAVDNARAERDEATDKRDETLDRLARANESLEQANERIRVYEAADSERIAAEEAKKKAQPHRARTGTEAMRAAEAKLARPN